MKDNSDPNDQAFFKALPTLRRRQPRHVVTVEDQREMFKPYLEDEVYPKRNEDGTIQGKYAGSTTQQ